MSVSQKRYNFASSAANHTFFCLFRFVSKQVCWFRLFRYMFEAPKQTEKVILWFYETNQKTTETDGVSVLFSSNRNRFCLFRGHPNSKRSVETNFLYYGTVQTVGCRGTDMLSCLECLYATAAFRVRILISLKYHEKGLFAD